MTITTGQQTQQLDTAERVLAHAFPWLESPPMPSAEEAERIRLAAREQAKQFREGGVA